MTTRTTNTTGRAGRFSDTLSGWRSAPGRLLRRKGRTSKGAAELSVVVVAASLVAGVLFGNGLTRTAVDIADGLTWFTDDPSGEVIQVNPATGRPEVRLKVGEPGDSLDLEQYDGRIIVTNRTTGKLTSFDLSSILASGQRRVPTGTASDVLHHEDDVFLIDRDAGTISDIDPVSTDAIGELWASPAGIADAAVDSQGRIWALDPKGLLTELRWSSTSQAFITEDDRQIDYSGAGSVLVGHDQGVTVFGPDAGIVVQVGTSTTDSVSGGTGGGHSDVVADAPRLSGELLAPTHTPADLVPVSAPQTGTVAILSDDDVLEVSVDTIGCSKPGTPEVFEGTVYVPCPGDHKVLRLNPDGTRAGADIELPDDGEPSLVLDDGTLLINVPGAPTGVIVDSSGEVATIVRSDDTVPTTEGGLGDLPEPPSAESISQIAQNDVTTPNVTPPVQQITTAGGTPSTGPSTGPTNGPSTGPTTGPTATPTSGPSVCVGGTCVQLGGNGGGGSPSGNSNTNGYTSGGGGGGGNPTTTSTPTTQTTTTPTTVTTPTIAVPQTPLAPPSGVTAVELPSGDVQVSWNHAGTTADSFSVDEVGGKQLARIGGATRKVDVTLPVGDHRVTVTALKSGDPSQTSAPSAVVSTSTVPSAVSGIGGGAAGSAGSHDATVTISWTAAAANGSPVLGYTVVATDTTGTRTLTPTGTSTSYVTTCATAYCDPGPVQVKVTARNAKGLGPATTGTVTYNGPVAPPLPAAGAQLVTADNTGPVEMEGMGTTTLTLSNAWAGFAGTCTWSHSGNTSGADSGTVPCGAAQLQININNGLIQQPGDGTRTHSIVFTADNGIGAVTSATYTWQTQQPVLCQGCQIP